MSRGELSGADMLLLLWLLLLLKGSQVVRVGVMGAEVGHGHIVTQ